jgi:hypothetical protein
MESLPQAVFPTAAKESPELPAEKTRSPAFAGNIS